MQGQWLNKLTRHISLNVIQVQQRAVQLSRTGPAEGDAYRGRNASAVSHDTRKLLHNRCEVWLASPRAMAMDPKNVFNIKADFKVPLPLKRVV